MAGKKSLCFVFILVLFGLGCQKYPDGPFLSFNSKMARITNHWVPEQILDNGADVTQTYDNFSLILDESGDVSWSYTSQTDTVNLSGIWEFSQQGENLRMIWAADEDQFSILRLKMRELWLWDEDNQIEYKLVPR